MNPPAYEGYYPCAATGRWPSGCQEEKSAGDAPRMRTGLRANRISGETILLPWAPWNAERSTAPFLCADLNDPPPLCSLFDDDRYRGRRQQPDDLPWRH